MKKRVLVVIMLCICGLFSANAHDLIVLKDGNIIEGKVMEIHPAEIKYKRSNNLNGPMIVIPSDRVFSIRYENGVVDVINAFPTNTVPANTAPRAGQASAQPSVVSSADQQSVIPDALLIILNQMPAIKVAGNNLKFMFNGDTWTAMLNGENFSTGTISVEEAGNGSILTLKQTHIWPGAAANTAGKALGKLPGGGAATGALNTAQAITGPVGPVEASGTEIVLEYKAGPPAKLSYLKSQTNKTSASSSSSNSIPSESVVVFDGNGHKYEVIDTRKTWTNARLECEKRGGYLATVTSDEEQKFIEDLISKHGKKKAYWLGGNREGKNWQWVTGESFVYTNWAIGEPNNQEGKQNKMSMIRSPYNGRVSLGQWDDENNTSDNGYICEWD